MGIHTRDSPLPHRAKHPFLFCSYYLELSSTCFAYLHFYFHFSESTLSSLKSLSRTVYMDFWTDTVFDLLLSLKPIISLTLVDMMSSIVSVREASLTLSLDSEIEDKLANLNLIHTM